jgi:hypothetical protein
MAAGGMAPGAADPSSPDASAALLPTPPLGIKAEADGHLMRRWQGDGHAPAPDPSTSSAVVTAQPGKPFVASHAGAAERNSVHRVFWYGPPRRPLVNETTRIEIPVEAETARALADARRREAVGRLVDRMVRPAAGDDPLAALLADAARQGRGAGLTDEEVDAELAAYNGERRG